MTIYIILHYIMGLSSLQIYCIVLARQEHGYRIFSTYFMLRQLLTCNRLMNSIFTLLPLSLLSPFTFMLQEFAICHVQNNVSNDLVLSKTFPETLAYNGYLKLLLNKDFVLWIRPFDVFIV